jgi:hypothetical protein
MNKPYIIPILVLFLSCSSVEKESLPIVEKITQEEVLPAINTTVDLVTDSIVEINRLQEKEDSLIHLKKTQTNTTDWSIEDFIVKCPKELKPELKQDITYYRGQWKDIENPITAIYKGNDFGDYHHIEFEDAKGNHYDFGFGNNDYGKTLLFYHDEQMKDNPEYLGQTFNVYWDWKKSTFPCCSGGYESVEAYQPSITLLELIPSKNRSH